MKWLLATTFLLQLCMTATAQPSERRNKSLPSFDIIRDEAQGLLNDYKTAVVRAVRNRTREYDLTTILEKFTPSAMIEMSSLRTRIIKRKTPYAYFTALKDLSKGINYDSVDITFPSDPLMDDQIEISKLDNSCTINHPFIQRFRGYRAGCTQPVYCDVTIRRIYVVFTLLRDGTYRARIADVTIDSTNACDTDESN